MSVIVHGRRRAAKTRLYPQQSWFNLRFREIEALFDAPVEPIQADGLLRDSHLNLREIDLKPADPRFHLAHIFA
jgi:hypothetical protein